MLSGYSNPEKLLHHHLALQPYVSLGLLCYSPPLISILSFPSPSFNSHLLKNYLDLLKKNPPRKKRKNNINITVKNTGFGNVDYSKLSQDGGGRGGGTVGLSFEL
jgi:hypothetical protein